MTDPLHDRDVAAIAAYRATGDRAHLDVLRMDGLSHIVHALVMERTYEDDPASRRSHTAAVDAFLDPQR